MLATAHSLTIPPEQELFEHPDVSPSPDCINSCGNCFFQFCPAEGLPPDVPSDTPTVLPSPTDDMPPAYIKQEQFSESDDEQFQQSMFSSQSLSNSYPDQLHAFTYEDQAKPPVLQASSSSSFPSGEMSANQCVVVKNEFPGGNGTSNAAPQSVTTDQANTNLGMCESLKVKLELPVPRQKSVARKAKPTPVHAIESSPLPPGIELPAILGGKLPPRTFKTKSKKRVYTERELRSRRKRGLPDDSDSESEERRQVRLPRRSLLTITTPQMSQFVTFMRKNLNLTPSQNDELSRQKRLVKNRESACRFRAKKVLTLIEYRDRVMELEGDVVSLRLENERLRKELMEATASSSTSSSSSSSSSLPQAKL